MFLAPPDVLAAQHDGAVALQHGAVCHRDVLARNAHPPPRQIRARLDRDQVVAGAHGAVVDVDVAAGFDVHGVRGGRFHRVVNRQAAEHQPLAEDQVYRPAGRVPDGKSLQQDVRAMEEINRFGAPVFLQLVGLFLGRLPLEVVIPLAWAIGQMVIMKIMVHRLSGHAGTLPPQEALAVNRAQSGNGHILDLLAVNQAGSPAGFGLVCARKQGVVIERPGWREGSHPPPGAR